MVKDFKTEDPRGLLVNSMGFLKLINNGNLLYEGVFYGLKYFNINKGKTRIEGDFTRASIKRLFRFNLPVLPANEYNGKTEDFKIIVTGQKQIASIDLDKKIIYVSREFTFLPYYSKIFIVNHEIGHIFYDSEYKADLYALIKSSQMFIPLSMMYKTVANTLTESNENKERITKILNYSNNI